METVNYRVARYGKATKGDTLPYGTLARASKELRDTYYRYGYFHDTDFPELPEEEQRVFEDTPEDAVYKQELLALLEESLEALSPRQANVIRYRYGIGMTWDLTVEETGEVLSLSSERIRQIQHKALRSIREYMETAKIQPQSTE